MLSQFNSLPGVYVHKEDGNLRILETASGKALLVLGTSPDGPLGLYRVGDTAIAESLFDPTGSKQGTLLKSMYEALESTSKDVTVFLYRIGASPMALDFVNGYTIVSKKSSSTAGSLYRIHYKMASGVENLRIYDAVTGQIYFDSTSGIDTGELLVFGQTASVTDMEIGGNDLADCPTFAGLKDFTQADHTVSGTLTVTSVEGATTFTTASDLFKAGQVVELLATGTSKGYFLVDYVFDNGVDNTVVLSKKLTYNAGVVTESSITNFAAAFANQAVVKAKYIEANNGLSLTLNEKHTALARAYWELESAKIDALVVDGIYLDEANVVDNEGRYLQDQVGYVQPTGDFLGKVYEVEHNGQLFFAYKTSFTNANDKTATILPTPYELGIDGFAAKAWKEGTHTLDTALVCLSQADIDAASDDIVYHEANFGHQMAEFLHGLSVNDNEAFGAIAMKAPKNFSKAGITQWLGKAPRLDVSTGDIAASGTGVLGYKFMSGSVGVAKGFFHTTTGYVNGTALTDRKGVKIDLGKYLDVVSTPLRIKTSYDGTAIGYVSSGVALLVGFTVGLEANIPTTNKKISKSSALAFSLAKKYLDELTSGRFVSFTTAADGAVKVVDGVTAALPESDWTRRCSNRIAGAMIEVTRNIADPFVGGITSFEIQASLESQINAAISEASQPEKRYLLGGLALVRATRVMQIRGEAMVQLQLVTAPELRRITVYVALAK